MTGYDMRRNESVAWDLQGKYATDVFTDEANDIIRAHDQRLPLFLYVAHLGVHAGNAGKLLEAPQEEIDKFRHIADPNRRTYAGESRRSRRRRHGHGLEGAPALPRVGHPSSAAARQRARVPG